MSLCAIEDKSAAVVAATYRSVSRNPVRFKALILADKSHCVQNTLRNGYTVYYLS